MKALRLAASILVVSVVACGGGGDNGSSMTGGASGSATAGAATAGSPASGSGGMSGSTNSAGSSSAGSSTGGSNSAGSSGSGNSSGSSAIGEHCTPGTPQPAINFFGGTFNKCPSVSGLTGDYNHLLDIKLSKPLGPGDTFAFSVDLNAPEGDFEVYGTTRQCGDVAEKLSSVHVLGPGIVCHGVKPVTGTYTHLIWVWRVAAEMLDTAVCEDGTCPGK